MTSGKNQIQITTPEPHTEPTLQKYHELEVIDHASWRKAAVIGPKEATKYKGALEKSKLVVNSVRKHATAASISGAEAAARMDAARNLANENMSDWVSFQRPQIKLWLDDQPTDSLSIWMTLQQQPEDRQEVVMADVGTPT